MDGRRALADQPGSNWPTGGQYAAHRRFGSVGLVDRATVEKIVAKPISGKTLAIKFQVLAIVSDGQLDDIHDILRHPAINLNANERPPLEEVA